MRTRDKGYVYFQDFIPENTHDIRVIVIGKRAFAIKRMIRENDFRASGSGKIIYGHEEINLECISTAFYLAGKLQMQSVAFDFIFTNENQPLLVEISYAFVNKGYLQCPGYWTSDIEWHEGKFSPEYFMIEDFVKSLSNRQVF
ncbi:hypothetical protein [Syntrophus gentianae]|nr:hypothetical protein [Syntrophus gentianae]